MHVDCNWIGIYVMRAWFIVFLAFNALDIILTAYGLSLPGFVELNPIVNLWGWPAAYLVRLLWIVTVYRVARAMNKDFEGFGTRLMVLMVIASVLPVVWNVIQFMLAGVT